MQLPIGILVYWTSRFEEDHAFISAMWYFQEMFVPSTKEEKTQSIQDLRDKRCTVINIHGTFKQIVELLSQGDRFINANVGDLKEFDDLIKEIEVPSIKAYLFDDVYHPKGTALTIDTVIDVEETMDEIRSNINKWKPVDVTIDKNWSWSNEIISSLDVNKNHNLFDYKIRNALTKKQEAVFDQFTSLTYTAGQILNDGFTSFEDFAFELVDEFGEEIAPFLKKIYIAYKDWPGQAEIVSSMDSIEDVYATDVIDLLERRKTHFRLKEEDEYAIDIAKSIMRKLLAKPDLKPDIIIAIGRYLQAVERLPLVTEGVNIHIEIVSTDGDKSSSFTKVFAFRITEEFFHIDISGIERQEGVGSDSFDYPSWFVGKDGYRDTECELDYLEREVEDCIINGATVTVEDYSEIESDN